MKKIALIIVSFLTLFLLCACTQGSVQSFNYSLDSSPIQLEITEETKNTETTDEKDYIIYVTSEVEPIVVEDVVEEPLTIPTDSIDVTLNEYGLELPINGATGYTSISMPLYDSTTKETVITTLEPGTAFQIQTEESDMWLVNVDGTFGWLEHRYCLINLPDVIPSMVYDNTNSYSSKYHSVGNSLEGITDKALYDATSYSARFSETEYLMPVLYSMSKKICSAQNEALKNGHCLKLYEGFRPLETQTNICNVLGELMNSNTEVLKHVSSSTWSKSWFISTNISNHQKGCAIDVSLVDVLSAEYEYCGDYSYVKVTEYEEFEMPTQMHELSDLATTYVFPVSSKSKTAWKNATLSSSMTDGAIMLQTYCTDSGLTPLASEWWHFNDLDARDSVGQNCSDGNFLITESCSQIPE